MCGSFILIVHTSRNSTIAIFAIYYCHFYLGQLQISLLYTNVHHSLERCSATVSIFVYWHMTCLFSCVLNQLFPLTRAVHYRGPWGFLSKGQGLMAMYMKSYESLFCIIVLPPPVPLNYTTTWLVAQDFFQFLWVFFNYLAMIELIHMLNHIQYDFHTKQYLNLLSYIWTWGYFEGQNA